MNLKPYRDYDEHDVINGLFALDATSANKGALVKIKSSGWVNGTDFRDVPLTTQANVYSARRVLCSEISLTSSGDNATNILGVLLRDVRDENFLGVNYLYDPIRKAEAEAVLSGEAVPILTKGLILVKGFSGTAGPNSGAVAADAGTAGDWKVTSSMTNSIGKFLGAADADGYALFKLEL